MPINNLPSIQYIICHLRTCGSCISPPELGEVLQRGGGMSQVYIAECNVCLNGKHEQKGLSFTYRGDFHVFYLPRMILG